MLVGFYHYHFSFHQPRDKSLVVPRQLLWSLWEDVAEALALRLREAEQAGTQWNRTLGANFRYHAPADHRRGNAFDIKKYLRHKKIFETRAKVDYNLNAVLLLLIVIAINILFDIFFWGLELEASELFEWNMNLMV